MINKFIIKKSIALFLNAIKITNFSIFKIGRKFDNNYIRVINYHHTYNADSVNLETQLKYFSKNFENVDLEKLNLFLNDKYVFSTKPGLILTFDDGFKDNFLVSFPLLMKYNFTGWFMVSTGKINNEGYMSKEDLLRLIEKKHIVGCHTYSHYRMCFNDTNDILEREIIKSKKDLEVMLNKEIKIFCWVGGEEEHYTEKAMKYIKKAGYEYSFLTNSSPLLPNSDKLLLERSNIDSSWPVYLVKYQISNFNDKRFKSKKNRVEKMLSNV